MGHGGLDCTLEHLMGEPTCIDLFCGAGGLSEGFTNAGFRLVAATDMDAPSANTFRQRHPNTPFIEAKIEDLTSEDLSCGLSAGELDCMVGGPPCQTFSIYNHKRGLQDERSGLFRHYLRIVQELMPKAVVIENVTGLLSMPRAVQEICGKLGGLGYSVEHRVLKAEGYGVPQERRRVFFVAVRDGLSFAFPPPSHGGLEQPGFNTVRDAIGDLPPATVGMHERTLPYAAGAETPYQIRMRRSSHGVDSHVAPRLGAANMDRMRHIPPGGSWRDIPHDLLPPGMKRARRSDHTKRYGRLHWDGLACTILTKCDMHWGAYIHPDEDRSLTVREAARFQSFPDDFLFAGSRTEQYRQIGNAVPPMLAEAVAGAVLASTDQGRGVGGLRTPHRSGGRPSR